MLENKEFYIELNDKIFEVELIKFSDTLNKALVYIPEKNRLEDVYVNELIIKDKEEVKVLPLTDEEKLKYCNMHFDCMDCSGCRECCPMVSKELTDERIEEIRMKLIKG
ncbi:hypothetical protein [Clostridium sp.]|uniref:hypothetical protein n=1 Tax=Clostridium sp. TaxID=1506 RepID=UPI0025BBB90A|nr:hypothetical protein [Clostridium sp.]